MRERKRGERGRITEKERGGRGETRDSEINI